MAGEATARGSHVIAWDIDSAGLDVLREDGLAAETHVVDVTDRNAVARAATEVGPIDVLILNAGVVGAKRFIDLDEDAIQRVMDVNAMAPMWCTKAFLPGMMERNHGHIVAISSIAGVTPAPGAAEYVASKHAVYGFLESLRTELHDDAPGVRTTVVLPQVIDTGMFEGVKTPWLFPPLAPERVADRVITAVEGNKERLLLDRPALFLAYLVRPLPPFLSDRVSRMAGAFDLMTTFQGRAVGSDERARASA